MTDSQQDNNQNVDNGDLGSQQVPVNSADGGNATETTPAGDEKLTIPKGPMRPLMVVLLLAFIVAAAYVAIHWGMPEKEEPQTITVMCMTEGCGHVMDHVMSLEDQFPLECPKCHKKSMVQAYHCPKCGEPMILHEQRETQPAEPGAPPTPTTCPKCGAEVYRER